MIAVPGVIVGVAMLKTYSKSELLALGVIFCAALYILTAIKLISK